MKPYGEVVHIQLTYDRNCPSNRCYLVFGTAAQAGSALQALGSFNIPGLRAETLYSRNVTQSDLEYVLNILERAAEESSPEARQAPTPRWFVVYYRNGRGNFMHATLTQKWATLPRKM